MTSRQNKGELSRLSVAFLISSRTQSAVISVLLAMNLLHDERTIKVNQVAAVTAADGYAVGGDLVGRGRGGRKFPTVKQGSNLFLRGYLGLFDAIDDTINGSNLPILFVAERADKAIGERVVKEFGELGDG